MCYFFKKIAVNMKKLILVFIFLTIDIQLHAEPFIPEWYLNASLPAKSHEIIGYGSANTLSEAMTMARAEIAKTLSVTIDSKVEYFASKKNGATTYSVSNLINEESKIIIDNTEIIKKEKINDTWYVAVKYTYLPLAVRIMDIAKQTDNQSISPHPILEKSPLFKTLKNEFNFTPKLSFFHKSGILFIRLNNEVMKVSRNEVPLLFGIVDSDFINFKTKNSHLKNYEVYRFNIDIFKNGYLSVFQVSQNGGVVLFIDNEPVENGMKLVYPQEDIYEGLEAIVPEDYSSEIELNVAALCDKKINNTIFPKVSEDVIFAKDGMNTLLQETKHCEIETLILNIRR